MAMLLLVLSGCEVVSGPPVIRAISLLPLQNPYARDFAAWVETVNERAAGRFRILLVGGPEALPTFQQADAVRTGVVHMVFGPATYYLGQLPEVEAMFASNLTPARTRENGGLALMDRLHRERMNVRYLARSHYIAFHVFTRTEPALLADGQPDLRGQRVRGGPVWRSFVEELGATFVNIPAPDVYTALERGTIDGVGWPIVGIREFSWDRHLHWRIDPGVFSSDVGIIFNADKWAALPEEDRDLLAAAAAEYEAGSHARFREMTVEIDAVLRDAGLQVLTLEPAAAARFRARATEVIWARLRTRAPQSWAALREHFHDE